MAANKKPATAPARWYPLNPPSHCPSSGYLSALWHTQARMQLCFNIFFCCTWHFLAWPGSRHTAHVSHRPASRAAPSWHLPNNSTSLTAGIFTGPALPLHIVLSFSGSVPTAAGGTKTHPVHLAEAAKKSSRASIAAVCGGRRVGGSAEDEKAHLRRAGIGGGAGSQPWAGLAFQTEELPTCVRSLA